ncbi:PREDICTED: putative late blight resistance protein homolog R1B-17 [Ipomoea nil]|uniref:putative late blight resistance protein homolog R1B-17 n=1 Tax=Ipomoea nil TaxID=35883 RepID=UPI000901EAC1|nr:PREDICTED: putative late blight resistance protein homolog R1B-17 [Ipomoea nil]
MAYVALTSLMATLELQFLQPIQRLSLHHHQPPIKSFFQNLSSLREFLDIFQFRSAPRDLETKIRDFSLEAEDNIETQLSNFLLLSKHTAHQEEASQILCRILQEAAQNAAELLKITNIEKDGETQRKITCDAFTSLIREIRVEFVVQPALHVPASLIESLIENISSLREFVEISNFHGAAIKDLATEIRDFAFKAKEDMEKQSWEVRYSRFTDKHKKLSNKLLQTLQEVAENTGELLDRISNTCNEADEANETQQPIPWLKHNSSQSVNVKGGDNGSSSRCSPRLEDRMVGRQNDVTTIKDQLFSGFGGLKVIPIIGMLGIGKTTLARRIFEDQLVQLHFDVKIWFTMPQKYNKIQILRHLLQSIALAEKHEIKEGRTLVEMMQECLIDRRYLIVLDDIWSTQHWDDIKHVFPRYVEGSRILLTTRFNEVADYACTFKSNHHVMSLLDPNESWELFCNIFPLERYRAPRFESFRSHMSNVVEKCEGLPQRSEIEVKTLLRLWVAEGFVKPSRNKELEKIAYCYLNVDRSLNDVVSTNLNLQTLVVCGSDSESQLGVPTLHLPSKIWESPQLRHLELGALCTVDPPSVVKKNLQTLSWVRPTHCRKKVYSNFPNIKKLKMFCKEDLEPSTHIGGSFSKHIILDNLDYLARIKSLTISVSSVGCIVTFPERCMFPAQLKKLSLSGTNLSGWDLTVIGSLKRLEMLKLENAFHEQVWRVVEGGFYGLKYLVLKDKKLKRLEACTDAFPCLEYLVLRCCHYLEEIPSSFGEIFFFKSIELDRCSRPSIVTSAKDIQEKLNKNFGKENFEIKIDE